MQDFDANSTGGQDLMDISAVGVTSADFTTRVSIQYVGENAVVAIDGTDVADLLSIDGLEQQALTASDFKLFQVGAKLHSAEQVRLRSIDQSRVTSGLSPSQ